MTDQHADTPTPPAVSLLEGALERAKAGDLTGCTLAYITREGGAAVVSTPISPVMLGHLARLFEERVVEAYRAARARLEAAIPPTAGIGVHPPPRPHSEAVGASEPINGAEPH